MVWAEKETPEWQIERVSTPGRRWYTYGGVTFPFSLNVDVAGGVGVGVGMTLSVPKSSDRFDSLDSVEKQRAAAAQQHLAMEWKRDGQRIEKPPSSSSSSFAAAAAPFATVDSFDRFPPRDHGIECSSRRRGY